MFFTLKTWQNRLKDKKDLIVQASVTDGSDSWTSWPIGMGFGYVNVKHLETQIGGRGLLVLCALNADTDQRRRPETPNRKSFLKTLNENGIPNKSLDSKEYFLQLPNYKFVVSPEGNGMDCHRHYEALVAGCIPIMEDSLLARQKYGRLPVLWTQDYSEITSEYLETVYEKMQGQVYDFSTLFLSSYSRPVRREIQENSDFWMLRLTGNRWYNNRMYIQNGRFHFI